MVVIRINEKMIINCDIFSISYNQDGLRIITNKENNQPIDKIISELINDKIKKIEILSLSSQYLGDESSNDIQYILDFKHIT